MNLTKKINSLRYKLSQVQKELKYYENIEAQRNAAVTVDEIIEKALTPKQAKVVEFILQKKTNAEIAEALGIVEKSVKFHKTRIFARFNVQNSLQLADLLTADRLIYDKLKRTYTAISKGPTPGSTESCLRRLSSGPQTNDIGNALPFGASR